MDAHTDISTRELTMTREFDAPRSLVFKMWTQPEQMARWMGCDQCVRNRVTNELRVGGGFRMEMSLADGNVHVVVGKYLDISEPDRLSFTWNWENGGLGSETVVTIGLDEAGGRTRMTFRHGLFDTIELCDAHHHGWSTSFGRLDGFAAGTN